MLKPRSKYCFSYSFCYYYCYGYSNCYCCNIFHCYCYCYCYCYLDCYFFKIFFIVINVVIVLAVVLSIVLIFFYKSCIWLLMLFLSLSLPLSLSLLLLKPWPLWRPTFPPRDKIHFQYIIYSVFKGTRYLYMIFWYFLISNIKSLVDQPYTSLSKDKLFLIWTKFTFSTFV